MFRTVIEIDPSQVRDELTTRLDCVSDFAYIETEVYENDGTVEIEATLEFPDEDTRTFGKSFDIENELLDEEELLAILNANIDELVKDVKEEVKEKLEEIILTHKRELNNAEKLLQVFITKFGE